MCNATEVDRRFLLNYSKWGQCRKQQNSRYETSEIKTLKKSCWGDSELARCNGCCSLCAKTSNITEEFSRYFMKLSVIFVWICKEWHKWWLFVEKKLIALFILDQTCWACQNCNIALELWMGSVENAEPSYKHSKFRLINENVETDKKIPCWWCYCCRTWTGKTHPRTLPATLLPPGFWQ